MFNKAVNLGLDLGNIHSIDYNGNTMITAISRDEGLTILK